MDDDTQFKPLPAPWDRIFGLGTRVFVWGLLLGILYLLRPFFLLVFLTFVFAYIQAHGVDGLAHRVGNRPLRSVLVFLVLLGALIAVGFFVAPHIEDQAARLYKEYPAHLKTVDTSVRNIGEKYQIKQFEGFDSRKLINDLIGLGDAIEDEGAAPTLPGGEDRIKRTMAFLTDVGSALLGIGSAFLLSLLFSFLIVLDLPRLTRSVKGLAATKIGFIYNEVADNIYSFCRVLGRALEAQLFIAITNTILTGIGMYILDIPNIVFFSTIVFLCSFIPVAGVFVSSTPICLTALGMTGGGLGLMALVIAMVLIVHFIEAYFLNPLIYGHQLRMNAVLVLIILTVAGKLFGIWGLILGLPVTNYVFGHAIRICKPEQLGGPSHRVSAESA
jgi:predicted PurR-regulated permease PerM